jgi:hypothetical protein
MPEIFITIARASAVKQKKRFHPVFGQHPANGIFRASSGVQTCLEQSHQT